MRTIKFEDNKTLELLKENASLSEQINKIVEEWKKKDEFVKTLMTKMERIKDKIRPRIADRIKKETELGEFEVISSTRIEKGLVVVDVLDQVEIYIEQLRANKAKQNDNEKSPDKKE